MILYLLDCKNEASFRKKVETAVIFLSGTKDSFSPAKKYSGRKALPLFVNEFTITFASRRKFACLSLHVMLKILFY